MQEATCFYTKQGQHFSPYSRLHHIEIDNEAAPVNGGSGM